jgi:hypothetical protein
MTENKQNAIAWIASGMDYNQGISLLIDITRKQGVYSQFSGNSKRLAPKLAYEICKASGLADARTWKEIIHNILSTHQGLMSVAPTLLKHEDSYAEKYVTDIPDAIFKLQNDQPLTWDNKKEYPPIIRRIIHQYAADFQERSRLHEVMTGMPESNTDAVCAARAEIFNCIKSLSVSLEGFYEAKQLYENEGILPDADRMFPPEGQTAEDPYENLTQDELKKCKKNLHNQISKDQSLLAFQSKGHKQTASPMPQGPKRIKIEYRIKQRTEQILLIDTALLKYVIAQ